MGEFPVRMARAVGTEGDGHDLYCTSDGLFLGPDYALIGGDLGKSTEGDFRIRPLDELNADLGEAFGALVDLSERMATLRGIAKALDEGDLSRALIGAAHLELPPLPDGAAALRLQKIDRLRKYNFDPNQLRNRHGEWSREGGGDGSTRASGTQVADASGLSFVTPAAAAPTNDKSVAETRAKIVATAQSYVGSQAWSDGVANGNFPAPSNKCNLFVYDATTQAGASPGEPNGRIRSYPPTAEQWADPNYQIPGWRVLGPDETPQPGDVVAQHLLYRDAGGHVMIVGPNNHVIGTGDSGNGPHGTIEDIPMPENLGPIPLGPKVFRRWSP